MAATSAPNSASMRASSSSPPLSSAESWRNAAATCTSVPPASITSAATDIRWERYGMSVVFRVSPTKSRAALMNASSIFTRKI